MREVLTFLVVAIIAIALAWNTWFSHPRSVQVSPIAANAAAPEPSKAKVPEKAKKPAQARVVSPKDTAGRSRTAAAPDPAKAATAASESSLQPVQHTYPFPDPREIAPRTGRSDLVERYGKPTLETSLVDRGETVETYTWQQESNGATTMVWLRDGKTVTRSSR